MDTAFLDPLIAADIAVKEKAFEYVAQRYEDNRVCSTETPTATAARVFFVPGKPVVNVEKALGRVTVRAFDVPVILKPEQDLVIESQVQRAPLPRGDPLADFASHVSERFAAIARTEPYRRMHNMYRLFLIGRVMNAGRQRPYDLHFWLTEYAVRPSPTEREIAAIRPKTVTHNCWGRPYAPNEFNAATMSASSGAES